MIVAQEYTVLPADAVTPHPENPRRGDVPAISESIERNGFYGAIVVQRSTMRILAGSHRWQAARSRGEPELPALVVDCDDETARRILLADNRSGDRAVWDQAALARLLRDMSGGGGLAGTGFSDADLARLAGADGGGTGAGTARYDEAAVAEAAFAYYRQRGFPYPRVPLHECMQQVNALAVTPTVLLPSSPVAHLVPDAYHPQRFAVRCPPLRPPLAAFGRDDRLRQAFALLFREGRPVTDRSLLAALCFVRGTQAAAQFRPGYALYRMRLHAPPGGRMLDTSAGWGGRLVGYAASSLSAYVGIDPSPDAVAGNARMCAELGIGGVTLIEQPAEDVDVDAVGGPCSFDFALTSPPYFRKELYPGGEQSHARYREAGRWREGFLAPMLRLQFAALKPGAVSVLNIADVRLRQRPYPLARWAAEDAAAAGFEVTAERMPVNRIPGRFERPETAEPVLVMRKPG